MMTDDKPDPQSMITQPVHIYILASSDRLFTISMARVLKNMQSVTLFNNTLYNLLLVRTTFLHQHERTHERIFWWLFCTVNYIKPIASIRFFTHIKDRLDVILLQSLESLLFDENSKHQCDVVLVGKTCCDWHLILICRLNMDYWRSSFRHDLMVDTFTIGLIT